MTAKDQMPDTIRHAKAVQGDAQSPSWGPLVGRLRHHLDHYRSKKMPPGYDFDDFVAEVLLQVLRDLPGIEMRSRGEFWSWLGKLADHVLVDMWRHSRAKKRGLDRQGVADEQVFASVAGTEPSPSGLQHVREIEAAEQDCIDRLPNELGRRVYALRRGQDLSFDQIAAETGQVSAASARFVFFQVKQAVRECLRLKLEKGYSAFFRRLDGADEA